MKSKMLSLLVLLFGLSLSAFCPFSWSGEISSDSGQNTGDGNTEKHFIGIFTMSGTYMLLENGDVSLLLGASSSKAISPTTGQREILVFSNQDVAIDQFGIGAATKKIDLNKFCGLKGAATIQVSDLQSGEGPARRWYTARLIRVISKGPYKMLLCRI